MAEAKEKLSSAWGKAAVWAAQRAVNWLWTAPEARELGMAYSVVQMVAFVEPDALVLPWMLFFVASSLAVFLGRPVMRAIAHHATASAGLAVAILAGCVWYAPERYLPAWVLAP